MTSRTVVNRGSRARGGVSLMGAVLLGLSLGMGGCGGGGGGGGGGDSTDGGIDYTPGDGPGSAFVSWAAPTEREDGRAISIAEVGGYRIHFGPVADPDQYVVLVNDGGSSQYTVTGLDPDTWYFAVSAIDTDGQESSLSNSMSKVIVD